MSPGPRPTSVPSGILIHPAVWLQQTWAENWGLYPLFGGSWVSMQHNVAWTKAYLHTKWHLDPLSCLAPTDMSRKLEGCAPLMEGELGPHLG